MVGSASDLGSVHKSTSCHSRRVSDAAHAAPLWAELQTPLHLQKAGFPPSNLRTCAVSVTFSDNYVIC